MGSLAADWEEGCRDSPDALATHPVDMALFVWFHYCQQEALPLPSQDAVIVHRETPTMLLRAASLCKADIRRFQTLAVSPVFKSWYDTAFGDPSQVCQGELRWNENCNRREAASDVLDETWGTTGARNIASGLLQLQPWKPNPSLLWEWSGGSGGWKRWRRQVWVFWFVTQGIRQINRLDFQRTGNLQWISDTEAFS